MTTIECLETMSNLLAAQLTLNSYSALSTIAKQVLDLSKKTLEENPELKKIEHLESNVTLLSGKLSIYSQNNSVYIVATNILQLAKQILKIDKQQKYNKILVQERMPIENIFE